MTVEGYVIAASAAVMVAAAVVLAGLLYRYNNLVEEADKSTRLAKDLWNSMNSRFSVIDGRIIDLRARTEVLSSKLSGPEPSSQPRIAQISPLTTPPSSVNMNRDMTKKPPSSRALLSTASEGTETEARVLRFLVDGPRSSAQIKDEVGKSREHTARLMKGLFERGLVIRNDRSKPYVYEITDTGKSYVAS